MTGSPLSRYAFAPLMTLLSSTAWAQDILTIPVDSLSTSGAVDIGVFEASVIDATALLSISAEDGSENLLNFDQDGLDNIAVVDQSGDLNRVGTETLAGLQDGNDNTLVILQTGDGNAAGTGTGGLVQRNDANVLRIRQDGIGSIVGTVLQVSNAAAEPGANVAVIVQSDDATGTGARLVILSQEKTLAGASNLVTVVQGTGSVIGEDNALIDPDGGLYQSGAANVMAIEQAGRGNRLFAVDQLGTANTAGLRQTGEANRIVFVDQTGDANRATAILSGTRNAVESIRQDNTLPGGGIAVVTNLAVLSLSGNDNGAGIDGELASFATGSRAEGAGVAQGAVTQIGGDNQIDIAVTGDANLFGVSQVGDGLFVSAVIDQDRNAFGIDQVGDGSEATVLVDGDGNDTGIRQQNGTLGTADAFARVTIRGGGNRVTLTQTGRDNSATVAVTGELNRLSIAENGTGNGTAALFGAAATVAGAAGIRKGTATQRGDLNEISLDILGSLNAFALSQDDDDNRIIGLIDGSGNAASVTQTGVQNVAMFSQRGEGNSLGMQQ